MKLVIRGIPADFSVEEIKADLCDHGLPVLSVHRLPPRRLAALAGSCGPLQDRRGQKFVPFLKQSVRCLGYSSGGSTQKRWPRSMPPLPVSVECTDIGFKVVCSVNSGQAPWLRRTCYSGREGPVRLSRPHSTFLASPSYSVHFLVVQS
ncbi:hypothetical protein EVAR_53512_1 [Eumeta japonica]|uniref:Pre-C2HC domain-containing protein n=1 Tax=Eumeta variegata TaxID=151549 RepID=A0A4C1Y4L1_EUMVA|nr:hypothetical protein EVAR_53512_1 [Eumeta japonica]